MSLVELFKTGKFKTDKGLVHSYLPVYDMLFERFRDHADILEIGIAEGGSLRLWEAYFRSGTVTGIDIDTVIRKRGRITTLRGDSTILNLGSNMFDIIIDDGSHRVMDQIKTFQHMKRSLRPDGIYTIEDVRIENVPILLSISEFTVIDLRRVRHREDDILLTFPPRSMDMCSA